MLFISIWIFHVVCFFFCVRIWSIRCKQICKIWEKRTFFFSSSKRLLNFLSIFHYVFVHVFIAYPHPKILYSLSLFFSLEIVNVCQEITCCWKLQWETEILFTYFGIQGIIVFVLARLISMHNNIHSIPIICILCNEHADK